MAKFDRRKFLIQSGGLLALPFFESLYGINYARAANTPLRALFFDLKIGIFMGDYNKRRDINNGTGGKSLFVPQRTIDELSDVKDYVNQYIGLSNHGTRNGKSHPGLSYTLATGYYFHKKENNTKPNQKNYFSWDQLALKAIGRGHFQGSMSLVPGSSCGHNFYSNGNSVTKYTNARQVFDILFPNSLKNKIAGNNNNTPDRKNLLKKSMLDFLVEDINSLKTKLNSSDKVILDRHLTSVREVESSINVDIGDVDSCHIPNAPNSNTFQNNAKHFAELIPLAYACDSSRVFSFSIGDERRNNGKGEDYNFLPEVSGVSNFHNTLTHAWQGANSNQKKYEEYTKMHLAIDRYRFSLINKIAKKLKDTDDGGGSNMLDNSLIFASSHMANGGTHGHSNLPVFTIGKAGNKIKTGRVLRYNGFDNGKKMYSTPVGTLQRSLLNVLGNNIKNFGDSGTGGVQAQDLLKS